MQRFRRVIAAAFEDAGMKRQRADLMWEWISLLALCAFAAAPPAWARHETGFLDRSVIFHGVEYRYAVYVPCRQFRRGATRCSCTSRARACEVSGYRSPGFGTHTILDLRRLVARRPCLSAAPDCNEQVRCLKARHTLRR